MEEVYFRLDLPLNVTWVFFLAADADDRPPPGSRNGMPIKESSFKPSVSFLAEVIMQMSIHLSLSMFSNWIAGKTLCSGNPGCSFPSHQNCKGSPLENPLFWGEPSSSACLEMST